MRRRRWLYELHRLAERGALKAFCHAFRKRALTDETVDAAAGANAIASKWVCSVAVALLNTRTTVAV